MSRTLEYSRAGRASIGPRRLPPRWRGSSRSLPPGSCSRGAGRAGCASRSFLDDGMELVQGNEILQEVDASYPCRPARSRVEAHRARGAGPPGERGAVRAVRGFHHHGRRRDGGLLPARCAHPQHGPTPREPATSATTSGGSHASSPRRRSEPGGRPSTREAARRRDQVAIAPSSAAPHFATLVGPHPGTLSMASTSLTALSASAINARSCATT